MTSRAALGCRATRLGLGALLTAGAALLGCGRIELGSHAVGDGSGASGSTAGNGGDRVLDRQVDDAPAEFDGVGLMSAAGQRVVAGGAADVSLYPTRGAGPNRGGPATIGDLDSSTVVTLGDPDGGATDAGDGVADAASPRGPVGEGMRAAWRQPGAAQPDSSAGHEQERTSVQRKRSEPGYFSPRLSTRKPQRR